MISSNCGYINYIASYMSHHTSVCSSPANTSNSDCMTFEVFTLCILLSTARNNICKSVPSTLPACNIYHITTILPVCNIYHITTILPVCNIYHITTILPACNIYHITTILTASLQYYQPAISHHYNTTSLQYHITTILPACNITSLQYYQPAIYITSLQYSRERAY